MRIKNPQCKGNPFARADQSNCVFYCNVTNDGIVDLVFCPERAARAEGAYVIAGKETRDTESSTVTNTALWTEVHRAALF